MFEGSALSFKHLLLIVYCWSLELSPDQIAREAGVDREAVVKVCKLCRSICELWLKKNSTKVGGLDPETGCPLVVALEMHKVSRPRKTATTNKLCWLLSGVNKSMGDFFIVEIPNDKPKSVRKAISDYVHTGTKVVTDQSWPAIDLSDMGYVHEVTPEDDPEVTDGLNDGQPYSTLWSQVRSSSGSYSGVTDTALDSYLHQWLFQNKARARGQGIFESFLMAIQVSLWLWLYYRYSILHELFMYTFTHWYFGGKTWLNNSIWFFFRKATLWPQRCLKMEYRVRLCKSLCRILKKSELERQSSSLPRQPTTCLHTTSNGQCTLWPIPPFLILQ